MTEMPQCPKCQTEMFGFVKYTMAKSKIPNRRLHRVLGYECPKCNHRMIDKDTRLK